MSACASVGELERIFDPPPINARHRLGDVTFDIHTRMYSRHGTGTSCTDSIFGDVKKNRDISAKKKEHKAFTQTYLLSSRKWTS